ncbi:DUF2306 domain-containing protein [Pseudochryseolinea flava]|nr:DUF2306 domain-containing protein [Pseudochryseolinea flava]
MRAAKLFPVLVALAFWTPVAFLSVLLAHNAMLYFTHGGDYGLVIEKVVAKRDVLWHISLYVHLITGTVCLLTPLFLFAKRFFRNGIGIHQYVGKLYVWITLIFVCPTGLYLALYAKGGLVTQVGFVVQDFLVGYYSYVGYRSIRQRDKALHFENMIRSYAMVAVVLSFRLFHVIFFVLSVSYETNYAISQWLGIVFNLLFAEIVILFIQSKQLKVKRYETA